jgi:hypothetical protein
METAYGNLPPGVRAAEGRKRLPGHIRKAERGPWMNWESHSVIPLLYEGELLPRIVR